MATVTQAVERARNDGRLPPTGVVSIVALNNRFSPNPRGSVRALLDKMFDGADKLAWAVILCRFKGEPADPARESPVARFYRDAFTPRAGGLVEYWRDASLGKVDISGSRVFGWIEVDLQRSKANVGSGATRSTLVDAAVTAAKRDGLDPVTGFFSQISVYIENWSVDGVPLGLDWSDPTWGQYWIDGSTDSRGKVTLTPPHDGNITAHEMGHGFGMNHDIGADLVTEYLDPCCILSQNNPFVKQPWMVNFGPALCLSHLVQKGWMYPRRLYVDDGGWMSGGISLPLASLGDPSARANLGIKLTFKRDQKAWDYFVEYVKPIDWNRGLRNAFVFIRRLAPYGSGQTPAHLGSIQVPAAMGTTAEFVETSGNVKFTVERLNEDGRILRVGALKL